MTFNLSAAPSLSPLRRCHHRRNINPRSRTLFLNSPSPVKNMCVCVCVREREREREREKITKKKKNEERENGGYRALFFFSLLSRSGSQQRETSNGDSQRAIGQGRLGKEEKKKGNCERATVGGGTGYVASWLIMKLLEHGYRVRTTVRSHNPDSKKDLSYLTDLPGASEKLQIFNADLAQPDSFDEAIQGCIGVFHVAHPLDFEDKEPEEVKTQRAINATLGILKACLKSKTIKRVIYTSSASTIMFNEKGLDVLDESHWSDVDFIRSLNPYGASYMISKTLTEKAALEFAEKHGLDLITVIPSLINGPFICPCVPSSVDTAMVMMHGKKDKYSSLAKLQMVHIDDVASAHIFLFEYPDAKGRYLCLAVDLTIDKLFEFLSAKYPECPIPTPDSFKEIECTSRSNLSSKKLLDTGFKYKYGLEEMYNGAIQCCKEKGFL